MIRDARQLDRYGIAVCELTRDYPRLLARWPRSSAKWTCRHSAPRRQIDTLGVTAAGILSRVAARAAIRLDLPASWHAHKG